LPHSQVLLDEALEALRLRPDGVYIDATFGRGGHSRAILARLGPAARLYALDRDPEALAEGRALAASDARFHMEHGSFEMLMRLCEQWAITGRVDGLLLDLGVSSPQLDDPRRGFSFQHDGALDMRMDTSAGLTAAQWLNGAGEAEIADVLWGYGEERHSRRIARRIVAERPVETTAQLADIIARAAPRTERHKHPATRAFQAIRIFINRELEELDSVLRQSLDILTPGGRLAVISFHSLEDRRVKRFMRDQARGEVLPRGLPVRDGSRGRTLRVIGKPVKAGEAEVAANPRARSAVLRVAERL
jgi:16S rRNA (cytosine1402-N4)-methyltransferase